MLDSQMVDLFLKTDPSSLLHQRFRALIWQCIDPIEGWLFEDEAELLMRTAALGLRAGSGSAALIEVGSYCGRSTCAIAGVVRALKPAAKLYAIDPHQGHVGAQDREVEVKKPTIERLEKNLQRAGLEDQVIVIQAHSWEVAWNKPVSFLFIDGLHDYDNVARDFRQFEPWLMRGGFAAFHDYGGYFPGVTTFVDELMRTGHYEKTALTGSMFVMERLL
ncbi:MAG: class I SAM-dependent methyltransferase [Bryobacteraceae bacterium]|jgi:hypothetical protein